jgi:hypothetical protein
MGAERGGHAAKTFSNWTFNSLQHRVDHNFWGKALEHLSHGLNVASILHTSLRLGRRNSNAMAIHLLRRERNERRRHKGQSMQRRKVPVMASAIDLSLEERIHTS